MFNKILMLALLSMMFIGCKSDSSCSVNYNSNSSSFNQETYVWESFMFPTNRTSGVQ